MHKMQKKIKQALISLAMLASLSASASNDKQDQLRSSHSTGKHLHSDTSAANKQVSSDYLPKKQLTREQVQAKRGADKQIIAQTQAVTPQSPALSQQSIAASYYDFAFYDVVTSLYTDIDEDGYYQGFTVTFDADILTNIPDLTREVYAQLYISEDGGPWLHLYTTETFLLVGESTEDTFTIDTELYEGYTPNEYDLLIDLYEVGYQDPVATISSDDVNSLYALPLESDDYDVYIEYHDHHSGSIYRLLFVLLFSLALRRAKHLT